MDINLARLKEDGQSYVDAIIAEQVQKAWDKLKEAKFGDNTPEELEAMRVLWTHGFMKGAEAATALSMQLYDVLNQKGEN